jgi:hypothetical protein
MNSSPKMGFVVANPESNNLEERKSSKGFFIGAISKPHLCIKFISFASFALHFLHSILKMKIFSICISYLESSTMFSLPWDVIDEFPPFTMDLARSKSEQHNVSQGSPQGLVPIQS